MNAWTTSALARVGEAVNRTWVLPLAVLCTTSRCHSRCVSCAWWERTGDDDLTIEEIGPVARALAALGTKLVVFSGGEPLERRDLFEIAEIFRGHDIRLHLLTSGLGITPRAVRIAESFDRVIVSLDGSTGERYSAVRGVDGFQALATGVARLKAVRPSLAVTARATLHKLNYRDVPHLVDAAKAMGADGISFLAADVASDAFGGHRPGAREALLLDREEVLDFRRVVEACVADRPDDFRSGFIAESPAKLGRLPDYYAASIGDAPFPAVSCSAPWVSAVIEANGDVRPCFFQPSIGNVRRARLETIVRSNLRAFRSGLDVATNPVCERCVCSLKTGWRRQPWK